MYFLNRIFFVQADGSAVDVHINLGQIPVQQINESQQRVNHIKKLLCQAKTVLSRLEVSNY